MVINTELGIGKSGFYAHQFLALMPPDKALFLLGPSSSKAKRWADHLLGPLQCWPSGAPRQRDLSLSEPSSTGSASLADREPRMNAADLKGIEQWQIRRRLCG